jgi:glycosyltransferase involved in cell wall biosynthesis
MKRISVCMPVYNGAAYLRAQLESILSQLDESDEVVISDDGSTDESLNLIESFGDSRIRVIAGPRLGHPSYNLEYALSAAQGNYLFLADQDDVWLPNKVVVMLEALKKYSLVIHDCRVTDEALAIIHPSFYALHGSKNGLINNFVRNSYLGCCMAFRRELLQKALPFPQKIAMHDIWLGLIGAAWFSTHFIPDQLLLYRRHGRNASTTSDPSKYSIWQQLELRCRLAIQLLSTLSR